MKALRRHSEGTVVNVELEDEMRTHYLELF